MVRLLVLLTAVVLTACTPPVKKDADWVRAEFAKEEAKGTAFGQLLSAVREAEPDIYGQFAGAVGHELIEGRSTFDAFMAGRPLIYKRFADLAKTAKDEHINGMLKFARDQYRAAVQIDPQLCLNIIRGAPDLRVAKLSQSLTDRDLALMAAVFRAGKQDGAVPPLQEVQGWMSEYTASHPDVTQGMGLMANPSQTAEEARTICHSYVSRLEGMLMEPPEKSARLFRGLLSLV
jgi:hypothetical protein